VQPYDCIVAGEREGQTIVGGFLLGGGNAWLTAREGFACDNVVAFEVVLADSSIINVTKDAYSDLFRALRGGWNNSVSLPDSRSKPLSISLSMVA
jgi:FAD/FMN-containing dehydrogenase